MENKLMVLAEQSGLSKSRAQEVLDVFQPFFQKAAEWEEKAKMLVITSIDQKDEMKLARSARLNLKDIRCEAERMRKKLKENILNEGRIIDGMANVIKGICEPIETHLEEQEKFVERQEAARILKLKTDREELLAPFGVDTQFYNLGAMSEDAFGNLLAMIQTAHAAKLAAAQKLEEERIAREKKEAEEKAERERLEAEERARIAAENARLKAEAVERERQIAAERAKAEAERKAIEEKARKEAEKREAEERRRIAAEKKAREEQEAAARAEREKAEAEILRSRAEAEKARRELEEMRTAEERARQIEAIRIENERMRLSAAGDKEKLIEYLDKLSAIFQPKLTSSEANQQLTIVKVCIYKCLESARKL
jgi:hypothetical protein